MKTIFCLVIGLFFISCSSSVNTFIQTSNEGIFIQSQKGKNLSLAFQNPSSINSNLEHKLKNALIAQGFSFDTSKKANFKLLVNLVDFRKLSYAQRVSGPNVRFFYSPFIWVNYDYEVENYYLMQVNLAITNTLTQEVQKTSLNARTNYLAATEKSKEALEDKIITQILSFFYLQ